MEHIDLTGRKINRLKVLRFDHSEKRTASYGGWEHYWLCECECGKRKVIRHSQLISKKVDSCGCMHTERVNRPHIDITGKRFGRLTVIEWQGNGKWLCKCDCGKQVAVKTAKLNNGHTKSCGCLNMDNIKTRTVDMVGRKFGRLTVIKRLNGHRWECLCECGRTATFNGADLRRTRNAVQSCGCLRNAYSDTHKIALKANRSDSQVNEVKHILFGKNVQQCNDEQLKKLEDYFTKTDGWGSSYEESTVVDFVKKHYKGKVEVNNRTVIAPKELDIYIPEKNLAIEYDGLIWHSDKIIESPSYHWNKTKMCMEKGIRLLHIYSSEWRDKREIVQSMILSALGEYERKEYARNCDVREVTDRKTVIDFFNDNHIQGAVLKYSLCLGLYKGDELLQAVVFGTQHFGRNNDVELYRMVTKRNTQVLGGFSKLMKHSPYDTVVSYVALRLFDAKGYLAGNWKIEHRASPSFCITDGTEMYSRHLFKKSECLKKFDNVTEEMTEREMQVKNGFYRIWDCGTYKVRWTREE